MPLPTIGSRTALVFLVLGAVNGAPARATEAPGAPGSPSHFDKARKDCLGTARNTTSHIWYTVAGGVLSDVYAPTVDTTQLESLQLLVTDGATFNDLQSRDTTYSVSADATGMVCTVTSTAKSGAYRVITTYITDPDRDAVLARVRYVPLSAAARTYRLLVRMDATAGGNGGGGPGNGGADSALIDTSTGVPIPVTFDTSTTTNAVNRDYAVPSFLALDASRPFSAVSSGFVGTSSDGLVELDATQALAPLYDTATGGNVEQTAALTLEPGGTVTLALGFGTTQAGAVANARASLSRSFDAERWEYEAGWLRYDAALRFPSLQLPGLSRADAVAAFGAYYRSANVVKASEDKSFPGAIVASITSPWGQAVSAADPGNTFFGSYREVFARDLYEAWTGLLSDGDLSTARDAVRFLFMRQQQPDGSFPRNSLVNGKTAPDSFNVQLDEVAYPILMAWQSGLARDASLYPHVAAAADYLVAHGPSAGPERWEEQSGYSPSTIAAEIAGLVAAASIAGVQGDPGSARVWFATADQYQRSVKGWAVTSNGPLSQLPYFIRLSKTGDPNAAISYGLGNGGPTLDQRNVIDAGFLELARLGLFPADDPDIVRSLSIVDSAIERTTASGPGWLRYNGDGYGDCHVGTTSCSVEGAPWAPSGVGTGHVWPVLAVERAEEEASLGNAANAGRILGAVMAQSSGVGLVPEQVWDFPDVAASLFGTDSTIASIGFANGKPDGSAAPLTWGAGALVRGIADLSVGKILERPEITVDRYVHHSQGATTLVVTSPPDQSAATGNVLVTGTTAPGATVDLADVAEDADSATTLFTQTAGADGSFSFTVPVAAGVNALVVAATAPDGGTAQAVRTVVNDVVNGTLLLSVDDPAGDDNGPGNYAYPTSSDFHAGAFDLQQLQVYDTGSTVTFRVQTRDLSPTFGSPLGAQLVDVYVHDPAAAAADTSTAAAFASRNYSIASPYAWSRLVEVQGFGQSFTDAHGNALGTVSIKANAISRYITFAVDKAALGGTPASGWSFTVVLAGQDGFSSDQARGFAPTPQAFLFGVCAATSNDPHCTADPGTVPKVVDTIPPSGVLQSVELDYTLGPVVLQGVTIP